MTQDIDIPRKLNIEDCVQCFQQIKTIDAKYQYSDNLHHKWIISSAYPLDFYDLGVLVGLNLMK